MVNLSKEILIRPQSVTSPCQFHRCNLRSFTNPSSIARHGDSKNTSRSVLQNPSQLHKKAFLRKDPSNHLRFQHYTPLEIFKLE